MTIRLDHTIVPAKDKVASAEFFADIFGRMKAKGIPYGSGSFNRTGGGVGPNRSADRVAAGPRG
jgi:hypothetical protein